MPRFDTPINTNDQSLDRVLANPLPVLLVLSPDAGSPALKSALDDMAKAEAGKLIVARVNTRENPNTAARFGAHGGTLLVTWKDGKEQVRLEEPTLDQIRAAADHLLGRGPAPRATPRPEPRAEPRPQPRRAGGTAGASRAGTQTAVAGEPITVSEANFEQQVLRSAEPVLVDFWAPWCGPCRMIAPTLEKLAREYAGKLTVAKLNVDENQQISMQYGVQGIPFLMLFKGGKPVNQLVGAHPEPNIRRMVEQALN
jgi:thioredoxin 1